MNLYRSTLISMLIFSSSAHAAQNTQWTLSSGATYTTGDYSSDEKTDINYIPVSLKYKKDKWKLKLTVPYLRMKGPQSILIDIGEVGLTNTVENKTSEGLGDVIFSANYQFLYLPKIKTVFDATGKIKFGTADEDENLGTGENDYTFKLGAYKLMGNLTPYITFGRRFYGENSEIELDDVFLGTLGLMYKVSNDINLGVDYYAKEKTASHRTSTQQLTVYSSLKIDKNWKVQGHLIRGLSDNTPDYGAGFSFSYQFD